MKRFLFTAALLTAATSAITAHTLDGIVKDHKTGEPLIGTVIRVKELPSVSTTTGLDGTFTLRELPDRGRYTLVVSYMAYKTREMVVDVAKDYDKGSEKGKDGQLIIALDEDLQQLGEVVVTGRREYRSDRSAVETVKNAAGVLNVMSQQSIQLSPDVNVASVLQRVSGVTMERDASGEASYAILRGMDKRYNYTLVNGVKIPSPDDKNRYVPLNIFPSDLMDRLVVSKSLTADMEGDAAGGVVDMVMKDAPARFQLQANAAVGMSDYFWSGASDYLTTNRSDYTHRSPYEAFGSDYKAFGFRFQKRTGAAEEPCYAGAQLHRRSQRWRSFLEQPYRRDACRKRAEHVPRHGAHVQLGEDGVGRTGYVYLQPPPPLLQHTRLHGGSARKARPLAR